MKVRPQGWRNGWRRIFVLLISLAAGAAGSVVSSETRAADGSSGNPNQIHQFDIPAGDAALRLNDFSNQSGLQLLFGFELMKGIKLKAVRGPYKPFDALDRMIAGTPIRYEFINQRTVTSRSRQTHRKVFRGAKS